MALFPWRKRTTDTTLVQRFLRGDDITQPLDISVQDPYSQSIAVYRCANIVASAAARIPYVVKSGSRVVNTGEAVNRINKPNNLMTWSEFLSDVIVSLQLYGNAMILIDDDDSTKTPRALLPIPPSMIRPIRGAKLYQLDGWEIFASGKTTARFSVDDIIHIKYAPHPVDRVLGIGPMEVARLIIDTDYAASLYNKSMLRSGGLPAGLLRYTGPGKISEEMKEEVRQAWARTYGGANSGSRVAVVNSDWTWQQMSSTVRDMDFVNGRAWNLRDIARAFNVPLIYLNELEKTGMGEAGVTLYRRLFYEENIVPLCNKLGQAFNEKLWSKRYKNTRVNYDFSNVEALREDFNRKLDAAKILFNIGFSPNSINSRLELGMEEMPWGDSALVPVNMVPWMDVVNHDVHLPAAKMEGIGSESVVAEEPTSVSTQSSVVPKLSRAINDKFGNSLTKLRGKILGSIEKAEEIHMNLRLGDKIRAVIESNGIDVNNTFVAREIGNVTKLDDILSNAIRDKVLNILESSTDTEQARDGVRRFLTNLRNKLDTVSSYEARRIFNLSKVSVELERGNDVIVMDATGCEIHGKVSIRATHVSNVLDETRTECLCVVKEEN